MLVFLSTGGGGSYQQAHSGVAYTGITLREGTDFREYIEVPLDSTLTKSCYHFEMYVNLVNSCNSTTSDIGVYFSDTIVMGINNALPLPFIPQITNSTGYITDTLGWTLISGDYTASGSEKHIIIGNFKDDANSSFITVNPTGQDITYFYIDDVSLTRCHVGIDENNNENKTLKIYPNPANEKITISSKNNEEITQLIIADITGKLLYQVTNEGGILKNEVDVLFLESGTYFIDVSTQNNKYTEKFVIVR